MVNAYISHGYIHKHTQIVQMNFTNINIQSIKHDLYLLPKVVIHVWPSDTCSSDGNGPHKQVPDGVQQTVYC
jgi:hypothetical protein